MMIRHLALTALLTTAGTLGVANADTYPVSGTWTYENASQAGPAKVCGQKIMQFKGTTRSDTGTNAPEYRNQSVTQSGASTWHVVDEFYTVQIWGRMIYTLRQIDEDHIRITLDKGGKSFLLRRCA